MVYNVIVMLHLNKICNRPQALINITSSVRHTKSMTGFFKPQSSQHTVRCPITQLPL